MAKIDNITVGLRVKSPLRYYICAKTAVYIALALMAMVFAYAAWTLTRRVVASLDLFDGALTTINRPCGKGAACGTLADVAKALDTIRGTAGQIEIAAKHENAQLATLDRDEAQLFADLHVTATSAQQLTASLADTSRAATAALGSADGEIQAMQGATRTLNASLAAAQPVLVHADALVTDPSIKRILAAAADTTVQVDGTATDVREVADSISNKFLHPPPKRWFNYISPVWELAWKSAMLAK